MTTLRIAGAGLAGLVCGYELARRGARVVLYERAPTLGAASVARFAGGMLAPWCEAATAEPEVVTLGRGAADWWAQVTEVTRRGTLVLAPPRDRAELSRFARRTEAHRLVDDAAITALEPDLAGRFSQGLHFAQEAHLDPSRALQDLARGIAAHGGEIRHGTDAPRQIDIDCTGMAAPLPDLRPVRGEMAVLHCPEVSITRTLRLLHPRAPLYLVPRGGGTYMIGATMVESSSDRPATLRALTELFSAAFALHPGFAEAAVIRSGAGLRPAFPDNLPRLTCQEGTWHLNGLYRHGFLLAPAMAQRLADTLIPETGHEDTGERRTA